MRKNDFFFSFSHFSVFWKLRCHSRTPSTQVSSMRKSLVTSSWVSSGLLYTFFSKWFLEIATKGLEGAVKKIYYALFSVTIAVLIKCLFDRFFKRYSSTASVRVASLSCAFQSFGMLQQKIIKAGDKWILEITSVRLLKLASHLCPKY